MDQGDGPDIVNHSSNHVLRPAKLENVNVQPKKSDWAKSKGTPNNIENRLPLVSI